MNGYRSGGIGYFQRLAQVSASSQRGGEIGGDGVACADDVNLAANRQRGHVFGYAVRHGSEQAALRKSDENRLAISVGNGGGGFFDLVQAQVAFDSGQGTQFGRVHFEFNWRKATQPTAAVGEDNQFRFGFGDSFGGAKDFLG